MTTYGYARVSTNGQDLAAQEAELMAAGCAKVFKEKVSGAKTDRAELAELLHKIESGDVLVVTRLDRHVPPAICSTSLQRSLSAALASRASRTPGQIRRARTVG